MAAHGTEEGPPILKPRAGPAFPEEDRVERYASDQKKKTFVRSNHIDLLTLPPTLIQLD
jgi:hypothetical protein